MDVLYIQHLHVHGVQE